LERQILTKENHMKELISLAALIATLYGGTRLADKIYVSVREAALTKAATGLPPLAPFARTLTNQKNKGSAHSRPKPKEEPIEAHR
jgi:hypothetical protein